MYFFAGSEFPLVAFLADVPTGRVRGRLILDKFLLRGVKPNDVQFAFVTTSLALADLDVPSDEIALVLEPFRDDLLQMIHVVAVLLAGSLENRVLTAKQ